MPKSVRFLELAITLPDGWFEMKKFAPGGDIRTFIQFSEIGRTSTEPIDTDDLKSFPRESYISLIFVRDKVIAPRQFKRRLTSLRKLDLDHGYGTRITADEQKMLGGRTWTCWEVQIPVRRFGKVEFLICDGHALVGRSDAPKQAIWRLSAMGPLPFSDSIRAAFSYALSNSSFLAE